DQSAPLEYQISLANLDRPVFHVEMKVPDVSGELVVRIPAWNALYQVRDFGSHMQEVEARVGADQVPIEKIDKQTWKINGHGTVRIDYATFWDEPGPFATQLNSEHAFINPAMVLLYVPGRTADHTTLSLSDLPDDWKAAGALKLDCGRTAGKQSCSGAKSTYDAMADAPLEVGKLTSIDVPGVEVPIRAFVHSEKWDKKRLAEELHRICSYELKLMEGAPFESYTFLVHLGKTAGTIGGGGMEHANSTAIA